MAVDACSQGGAAQGEFFQVRQGGGDAVPGFFYLYGVSGKLLAQGHGNCVLQVGASQFYQSGKLFFLLPQRRRQVAYRCKEALCFYPVGDVDRRGDDVVGGLAPVDVVVGVNRCVGAQGLSQQFVGPVGDDLVGVHVPAGAAAGLKDVNGVVAVPLPLGYLRGGLDDGIGESGVHQAEASVDDSGVFLDEPQGADHGDGDARRADPEVLYRPLGLGAPVGPSGYLNLSHRV